MGCDASFCSSLSRPLFQFTQPKRAATFKCKINFITIDVSIHAAQAGCDEKQKSVDTHILMFQFTQPKRAATSIPRLSPSKTKVSIHAAQAGCDLDTEEKTHPLRRFQFTQPKRAATHLEVSSYECPLVFQFTQPKRAATVAAKIQQKRDSLKG